MARERDITLDNAEDSDDENEQESEEFNDDEKGLLQVQWQQRQRRIEKELSELKKLVKNIATKPVESLPDKVTTTDLPLSFGQVEALLMLQEKRILQALKPKDDADDRPDAHAETKRSPPGATLRKPLVYRRKR